MKQLLLEHSGQSVLLLTVQMGLLIKKHGILPDRAAELR